MPSFSEKIFSLLGITRQPVVRAYDGYGDADDIVIYGHVLALSPLPRKHYRNKFLVNLFSVIRLFIVKPIPGARVVLEWNGETKEAFCDREGHFKFEWKPVHPLLPGWHRGVVSYLSEPAGVPLAKDECEVFVPHQYQFCFISDIDDTFLVSHSARTFRRLYLLLTKNSHSRKPFENVSEHYRMLSRAAAAGDKPNPFFYVSSSEWNLYYYIREFCRKHEFPRGVFLLAQQKQLRHLFISGRGKHMTKYLRIARILKSYPQHKYVLLGDNTQMDPEIYASVVRDFPGMICAVYIRRVKKSRDAIAGKYLSQIEASGVECCYFEKSIEAIKHSSDFGIIQSQIA